MLDVTGMCICAFLKPYFNFFVKLTLYLLNCACFLSQSHTLGMEVLRDLYRQAQKRCTLSQRSSLYNFYNFQLF